MFPVRVRHQRARAARRQRPAPCPSWPVLQHNSLHASVPRAVSGHGASKDSSGLHAFGHAVIVRASTLGQLMHGRGPTPGRARSKRKYDVVMLGDWFGWNAICFWFPFGRVLMSLRFSCPRGRGGGALRSVTNGKGGHMSRRRPLNREFREARPAGFSEPFALRHWASWVSQFRSHCGSRLTT